MTEEMIEHYTKLNAYYDEKVRQFKDYECRTCKDGEVYNDAWCRCQHPLIKGCRVKMSDGCEAKKLIKAQAEYEQMRKQTEKSCTTCKHYSDDCYPMIDCNSFSKWEQMRKESHE